MSLGLQTETLLNFIINYGYWAIFIGMVIEGPVITVLAGFLTSLGFFKFYWVYLIVVLADILGDSIAYAIGYFGRKQVLLRVFSYFQMKEEKLLGIEEFFKRHGGKSVFISKFIAGAGSWTLISAGLAKMNLKKFYKNSTIAALFKSALYVGVGYFFGAMYKVIIKWMNVTGTITIIICLAILVLIVIKKITSKAIKTAVKDIDMLNKEKKETKKVKKMKKMIKKTKNQI